MARSKPRKAKVEKTRIERQASHLDNRSRKGFITLVRDLTASILSELPPVLRKERMTLAEIDDFFGRDPEAPVILCTLPEEPLDEGAPGIHITINRHGVERELRARGYAEDHPSWERLVEITGKALRDLTAELLRRHASGADDEVSGEEHLDEASS